MHSQLQHVPTYIVTLEPLIRHYGYLAVAGLLFLEDFGILVPGETVLVAASFYAGLNQLNIFIIIPVAIIAAVIGDNVGFAIGEYGGHPLVEHYGKYVLVTPERLTKAENFFNRYGGRIVVIARFIDGLRELNGIIAGISEMKWSKFLIYNIIGASLWVVFWAMIGYFGGSHISLFINFELYFTIGVILIIALRIIYKHFKKKLV